MSNGYVVCEPINVSVVGGNFITDLSVERFNTLIGVNKPIIFSKISIPLLRGDSCHVYGTVVVQGDKTTITIRVGVNDGQLEISGNKVLLSMIQA